MTRHITGAWNVIWADMMSDDSTDFMRYGKGPRGLIGITIKPSKWKSPGSCRQVTLTIRNVQQSCDVFSVFDISPLSLIWMSHSGLVLGHKKRQSGEISESWSHIAKHWYCISVTGWCSSGGNFDSWQHGMEKPSPVMNGVHRAVWKG